MDKARLYPKIFMYIHQTMCKKDKFDQFYTIFFITSVPKKRIPSTVAIYYCASILFFGTDMILYSNTIIITNRIVKAAVFSYLGKYVNFYF